MSSISRTNSDLGPILGASSKKRDPAQASATLMAPQSMSRPRERRYSSSYGRHSGTGRYWLLQPFLRLVLGGAFVFAGSVKLWNPLQFSHDVENFRLVPHMLTHWVAVILPAIEVIAGGFVLAGMWLRTSALLLAGLLGVFLLAVSSALLRGLNIECGCFGTVGGRHVGLVTVGTDLMLLIAAVMLLRILARPAGGRRSRTAV